MKKALLSWSSGKDSAWTLHVLRQRAEYEVVGLFTSVNSAFDRVAMHGTRVGLLKAQAQAASLPLHILPLPWPCSNDAYEGVMRAAFQSAEFQQVSTIAFGDLFLRDIREYREKQLALTHCKAIFPLWEQPTAALAREMISRGLRAKLTCVDPKLLPARFAGMEFDEELLQHLPSSVDPCGENGEFHTFVYDGPMFSGPIAVTPGETVSREGFVYADFVGPTAEDSKDLILR